MGKLHLEIYDDFGRPIEEPAKCGRCKTRPADDPHTCPFAEEMDDDHESTCDCCEECTYQCAMDV